MSEWTIRKLESTAQYLYVEEQRKDTYNVTVDFGVYGIVPRDVMVRAIRKALKEYERE